MRVTRSNINKTIMRRFGWDIKIEGSPKVGCYHFYSDHRGLAQWLASWYSTTVYVCHLSDLNVDGWADAFESLIPNDQVPRRRLGERVRVCIDGERPFDSVITGLTPVLTDGEWRISYQISPHHKAHGMWVNEFEIKTPD